MSLKRIEVEFGDAILSLAMPNGADMLTLPDCSPLNNPESAVRHSLMNPIGARPLPYIVAAAKRRNPDARAVIVVSDNTRPVPYLGKCGILEPVLDILAECDIRHIGILVANGTHRSLSEHELGKLLPARCFESGLTITNHVCTDRAALRFLGRTGRGTEAWINERYMAADIRILTGLVEPHFMAGVSGGRKALCPGLVGEKTTHIFHGPALMADDRADSLIIEGNPCHEEALDVACMAGADFIVNATIDRQRHLTGVYSGDMIQAHAAATARVVETNAIPIREQYDFVLTHAGVTGVNHYQAAKACVEAVKAVRRGGNLVIAANHTDPDPVGSANYKRVLPLLREHGADRLLSALQAPGREFVPEQWEVQMWARVMKKLGSDERLVYCSPCLTGEIFRQAVLPGTDGGEGISGLKGRALAEKMIQRAIDRFCAAHPHGSMAVLSDGPFGVPVFRC